MKNLFKWSVATLLLAFTLIGCSSDAEDILNGEDIEIDVDDNGDARVDEFGNPIDVNGNSIASVWEVEGDAENSKLYTKIAGEANGLATALVSFTTTESTQRRLYVTQTLPGESPLIFEIEELRNRDTKADGSIDLDGDTKDSLEFAFDLNVPSSVDDGSIVYNFWTTSGKGDFTDTSKKRVLGVATIEVVVGTGVVDSPVRSFNGITLLEAPLGDGSSDTFMSLFNGEIYAINEGSEVAALWDFGYYYGATGLASFASANNYPSNIVDIVSVANSNTAIGDEMITNDDLKTCFFSLSTTFDSNDFDSITNASELDVINQSTSQRVTRLEKEDVVEFVSSGIKGLIRVVSINGTDGSEGNITFDIKVQPYAAIINN